MASSRKYTPHSSLLYSINNRNECSDRKQIFGPNHHHRVLRRLDHRDFGYGSLPAQLFFEEYDPGPVWHHNSWLQKDRPSRSEVFPVRSLRYGETVNPFLFTVNVNSSCIVSPGWGGTGVCFSRSRLSSGGTRGAYVLGASFARLCQGGGRALLFFQSILIFVGGPCSFSY